MQSLKSLTIEGILSRWAAMKCLMAVGVSEASFFEKRAFLTILWTFFSDSLSEAPMKMKPLRVVTNSYGSGVKQMKRAVRVLDDANLCGGVVSFRLW